MTLVSKSLVDVRVQCMSRAPCCSSVRRSGSICLKHHQQRLSSTHQSADVLRCLHVPGRQRAWRRGVVAVQAASADLKALIFDCDGVILESEDLHRRAYNEAFAHFNIRCNGVGDVAEWSESFYDMLQNRVGGGKQKMRWFFGQEGWPSSTVVKGVPSKEDDQSALIDVLQDWKSAHYQELVGSGTVEPRPGVIRLYEEAREAGLKVAVCSAATKSSVILVLENLLGPDRFEALDVFLAGDDVPAKKPDPTIYRIAAERLGVSPEQCIVIEDSVIGAQAAIGAGMRCIVTWTLNTRFGKFETGVERIVESLEGTPGVSGPVTINELLETPAWQVEPQDDRLQMSGMEL